MDGKCWAPQCILASKVSSSIFAHFTYNITALAVSVVRILTHTTLWYIQVENHFFKIKGEIGMDQNMKKERTRCHYTAKTHKATRHHPYIFV